MKLYVCAIRDIKTDLFGMPLCVPALGAAIRSFEDQCKGIIGGADSTLRNHPEDFELYKIAEYDDAKGEFVNDKTQLLAGSNYKRD